LRHESFNGWMAPRIALYLRELCEWVAEYANQERAKRGLQAARPISAKEIPCKLDDDATGGAVRALSEGYLFIPVGATQKSYWEERYPNKRSEMWFTTKERATKGLMSWKLLPQPVRERLKVQALAPLWKPDAAGRRQVEKKPETKKRLKRSPDDMDAVNLAYTEAGEGVAHWVESAVTEQTMGAHLGVLGRGSDGPGPAYRERTRARTLGRR
jgi:hypothetical protein